MFSTLGNTNHFRGVWDQCIASPMHKMLVTKTKIHSMITELCELYCHTELEPTMNRSGDIWKQFLSVLVKTLQKHFVFPKCDPLFLISDRYDMTLANACVALSQRWIKVSGSRILLISLCLEKLIFYTQSESFSSGIYHLLKENAFIMVIVLLPGILHSVY